MPNLKSEIKTEALKTELVEDANSSVKQETQVKMEPESLKKEQDSFTAEGSDEAAFSSKDAKGIEKVENVAEGYCPKSPAAADDDDAAAVDNDNAVDNTADLTKEDEKTESVKEEAEESTEDDGKSKGKELQDKEEEKMETNEGEKEEKMEETEKDKEDCNTIKESEGREESQSHDEANGESCNTVTESMGTEDLCKEKGMGDTEKSEKSLQEKMDIDEQPALEADADKAEKEPTSPCRENAVPSSTSTRRPSENSTPCQSSPSKLSDDAESKSDNEKTDEMNNEIHSETLEGDQEMKDISATEKDEKSMDTTSGEEKLSGAIENQPSAQDDNTETNTRGSEESLRSLSNDKEPLLEISATAAVSEPPAEDFNDDKEMPKLEPLKMAEVMSPVTIKGEENEDAESLDTVPTITPVPSLEYMKDEVKKEELTEESSKIEPHHTADPLSKPAVVIVPDDDDEEEEDDRPEYVKLKEKIMKTEIERINEERMRREEESRSMGVGVCIDQ